MNGQKINEEIFRRHDQHNSHVTDWGILDMKKESEMTSQVSGLDN